MLKIPHNATDIDIGEEWVEMGIPREQIILVTTQEELISTEDFITELFYRISYGIEFIHPIREGRSDKQIGRKGISNHPWIVGGKLCLLLNHLG